MAEAVINYVAVLVAAVAAIAVGSLWYSPLLFGRVWMDLMGFTKKDMESAKKKGMHKIYALAFLGTLVMSYVLAHLVDYLGASTPSLGVQAAFWLWLGLVAPVLLGMVLWENKSWKLYAINATHWLVSIAVMASILSTW